MKPEAMNMMDGCAFVCSAFLNSKEYLFLLKYFLLFSVHMDF